MLTCKSEKSNNNSSILAIAGLALSPKSTSTKVSTAAELTVESNADYEKNTFGLVTPTTLKNWITNWNTNKPSAITGNLVVITYYPSGTYTKQYLIPKTGVKVYDWSSSVFNSSDKFAYRTSRDNGIITDPNTLPTGATTDEILQTYGIDLTKDLIVFAGASDRGAGTDASPKGSNYQTLGRAVYWLRYWGVDSKNIGLLNGALDANGDFTAEFISTDASVLSVPTKGTFSVKQLKAVDNSILVQPLENVIEFAKSATNHGVTGVTSVFLADARHNTANTAAVVNAEYEGNPSANTTGASGPALFAGRIKGSIFSPWPKVIDQTTGKYKSKTEIAALWSDLSAFNASSNSGKAGYKDGQTIVHYCRTNARSMVTGMSTFLILGKPSIFYENSFIEWSALSANNPNTTLRTLPAGHKFATDIATLTDSSTGGPVYNATATITQYSSFNINTNAVTTRKNIDEDKLYKNQ